MKLFLMQLQHFCTPLTLMQISNNKYYAAFTELIGYVASIVVDFLLVTDSTLSIIITTHTVSCCVRAFVDPQL